MCIYYVLQNLQLPKLSCCCFIVSPHTLHKNEYLCITETWSDETKLNPYLFIVTNSRLKSVETQRGIIQANNDNNQLFFLHLNFELNSVIQFQQQQQIKIFRKNEKITGLG